MERAETVKMSSRNFRRLTGAKRAAFAKKQSGAHAKSETLLEDGTGHQGLAKIRSHCVQPKKRFKPSPLRKADKLRNHGISSRRALNGQALGLCRAVQNRCRTLPQPQEALCPTLSLALRAVQFWQGRLGRAGSPFHQRAFFCAFFMV
jgi:hypothetical protein